MTRHIHSCVAGRRRPDPATEALWRERCRRFAAGGQSVRQFCAAGGIAESAFYYWRRELQRRDSGSPGVAAAEPASGPPTAPAHGPARPSAADARAKAATHPLGASPKIGPHPIAFAQVMIPPRRPGRPNADQRHAAATAHDHATTHDRRDQHDGGDEQAWPSLCLRLHGGRELLLPACLPIGRLAALLHAIEEAA